MVKKQNKQDHLERKKFDSLSQIGIDYTTVRSAVGKKFRKMVFRKCQSAGTQKLRKAPPTISAASGNQNKSFTGVHPEHLEVSSVAR